jgi:anhydro-N-acetylmuramic acid kinase
MSSPDLSKPLRVLGLMSGTSLDGIDLAVLETDGQTLGPVGAEGSAAYRSETLALVKAAIADALQWPRGAPVPPSFAPAEHAITQDHATAIAAFRAEHGLEGAGALDLIGFHGQTILHEPPTTARPLGRTVQLGDGAMLARETGLDVVYDFRTADVASGGHGAPFAPAYHVARMRAAGLQAPVAALNLGGVANLTYWGGGEDVIAFDCGPANGPLDQWVLAQTGEAMDRDGKLARSGTVHDSVLMFLLDHPFFGEPPPKSLDRYDFGPEAVRGLSPADGAATLAAFTAGAVALGLKQLPTQPNALIVAGGGRKNPAIMAELAARTGIPLLSAEEAGWRGDAIEAEAFAYLAARVVAGLPLSFPGTTGVPHPMLGGKIARAS